LAGEAGDGRDARRRQLHRRRHGHDHDHDGLSGGRIRVALIAGGRSSEHEISLASARSVLAALDPERYAVVTVAIGRDGRWALEDGSRGLLQGSDPGPRPVETLPVPAEAGTLAALGAV